MTNTPEPEPKPDDVLRRMLAMKPKPKITPEPQLKTKPSTRKGATTKNATR